MERSDFYQEVYAIVKEIPPGTVITYGLIARLTGYPQRSRMVGQALYHAPAVAGLPCHRVVNSSGKLVPGWEEEQRHLLEQEGITFRKNGQVNISRHLWKEILL